MFNEKRIKELEIKMDLILSFLDLMYVPALKKREPEIDKKNEEVETSNEKVEDAREQVKMICPFYHRDENMRKVKEMKKTKKNKKKCVICGEPLTKAQRKVCGKIECREKYALEYVYKKEKRMK